MATFTNLPLHVRRCIYRQLLQPHGENELLIITSDAQHRLNCPAGVRAIIRLVPLCRWLSHEVSDYLFSDMTFCMLTGEGLVSKLLQDFCIAIGRKNSLRVRKVVVPQFPTCLTFRNWLHHQSTERLDGCTSSQWSQVAQNFSTLNDFCDRFPNLQVLTIGLESSSVRQLPPDPSVPTITPAQLHSAATGLMNDVRTAFQDLSYKPELHSIIVKPLMNPLSPGLRRHVTVRVYWNPSLYFKLEGGDGDNDVVTLSVLARTRYIFY